MVYSHPVSALPDCICQAAIHFALNTGNTVPAFHGHAHNHLCQLSFHTLMSSGFGLEDLETCERVFAGSNAVAQLTQHATPFHQQQFIDIFFHQWYAEKYENLGIVFICIFLHSLLMYVTGQFFLKNYQQALEILHDMPVCIDTLTSGCKVPDTQFTKWLKDECKYLNSNNQSLNMMC